MTETLRGSTPQSEFILTTTLDDEIECACEGCHDDVDDQLKLLLGCDARGMVADYGTVGFCSLECARQFVSAGPYQSLEEDLIVYTQQPVVATVVHNGEVIEATLGFDVKEAIEAAAEIVAGLVDDVELSPDDFSIEPEEL
ncbi:hypothetical protein PN417_14735 [Halorubrum ezzemoulense]|uniref:hypothetical protein n=1 Tax=Halorubrum ezzemoulense TaxID=337243 RepID=UPI00232C37BE|nr:hypothetical protein [Halorubrum ezzemoulense]MDB9302186.1 hypothetical protein [Halorubrum ezzemoulense]